MAVNFKQEQTYVMVKPDGVRKGLIGEIIRRFEQRDLKIVAIEMFQPTREQIDNHYPQDEAWLRRVGQKTLGTYAKYGIDAVTDLGTADDLAIGKMVRTWLLEYMVSTPLVRMIVEGAHAVDTVRKICGNTLPNLAEVGTIRGDFSADSAAVANSEHRAVMNLIHASETPAEARHEIEYWFGGRPVVFSYQRLTD